MIYNSCMAKCAFAVVKNKDGKILLVQIAPPFREDHKWNFPPYFKQQGNTGVVLQLISAI